MELARTEAMIEEQSNAKVSESKLVASVSTMKSPCEIYVHHKGELRDMIAVDHFSNAVPLSLIDQWLLILDPDPDNRVALPPGIKGFYGGDLRASIPIELAHDCYKYIVHETKDRDQIAKYAGRMLIAVALLDLNDLETKDANLAGLALWHKALAQVRLAGEADGLADTLRMYERVRRESTLPDAKLPRPGRLKARLLTVAEQLGLDGAIQCLRGWGTTEDEAA
ncbi:hypothetical protein Micbo1qcDRAFT_207713 [Microdochium bolleyi]|uniref:Uncharacterized protein n=1 Tax=Microdochium bolleyi TaxID=196109 RepID=A0A136ISV2_9PEZI|nr:hypothetical protein Micbo1qcDRAFT_207713 [Microdochium bolleyi]